MEMIMNGVMHWLQREGVLLLLKGNRIPQTDWDDHRET